jgi:hypothetical protein
MDRVETLKVFSVIKANYSNFFKSMSKVDAEAMVALWAEMFADVAYSLVGAAVKTYIATDTTGFPPNVGQINEQIRKLTQKEQMTEQEAISLIMKAAQNGIYGAEQEFEKLPPVLQRLAGSPNQIKAWAMMDVDELQTVVSSNLMRSYRVIAKNEEIQQSLPGNIKNLIESAADKLRIEG